MGPEGGDRPGPEGWWAEAVEAEIHRLRPGPAGDGPQDGADAHRLLFGHLPPGYAQETAPADAAWDLLALLGLMGSSGGPVGRQRAAGDGDMGPMAVAPPRKPASGDIRLRRAGAGRIELSSFLRVLESFGLVAVEAVPWHFSLGERDFYIDDIGLRRATAQGRPSPGPVELVADFTGAGAGERLTEAIAAVASGRCELSPLDSLVIGAGLSWQEVNLLGTYCHYRGQAGGARAEGRAGALVEALGAFPEAASAVVRLFRALLAPGQEPRTGAEPAGRAQAEPAEGAQAAESERAQAAEAERARADMARVLGAVPDREHDGALRELVAMVEATVRTTWAPAASSAGPVALKLASAQVPFLPSPRPFAEIYVRSPWFEGLHLRFGPVARGGVRWSDRASDLRGEVLGLARAQVKKNSLIVPTGAKGAFSLSAPAPHLGAPAYPDEGAGLGPAGHAYRAFIGALLDLTDNIVDGRVSHPPITCRDGDDPYLVVAADKGTAHFSDLANELSVARGYWLGDAFASGGSQGYDHKALGITARGAWLAVRRHFRALGMDASSAPLRVAGVGDMSGDVFGNGMLQSRHLRLVAAFDHRHIFIDPSPPPEAAFEERARLSRLPGSSWADYDLRQASPGAAVYPRGAKQVELSPEARQALALPVPVLAPPDLVKAVLKAPVDLLFFGGVGTFVRGPGEDDGAVEDHANDDVRLDAGELRARVIAEGANLAMTQAARAAYSRRGGRANADFIDNAAGVALSDREVNMKVLLQLAVAKGALGLEQRSALMAESEDEAARKVLQQVDDGIVALDRAAASSPADFPAYCALLADLEAEGLLDRGVEALPSSDELARRAEAGAGFSRPELAVLVAYARSELARSIEASPLAAGDDLESLVLSYFPEPFRRSLAELVPEHPLSRQLAASQLANEILAVMGPVWAHESAQETGRSFHEAAAAYWAARQVLRLAPVASQLAEEANSWPVEAEHLGRDALAAAVGRLARWYLLHPGPVRPAQLLVADGPLAGPGRSLLGTDEALEADLTDAGVPAPSAHELARLVALSAVGQASSVGRASGRALADAVSAMEAVAESLWAAQIERLVAGPAPADRWDRRQVHLLSDDLGRVVAAMAATVLSTSPGLDGRTAVAAYLSGRAEAIGRYRALAATLPASAPVNLSLLALTLRAMALVGQGQAEEAGA